MIREPLAAGEDDSAHGGEARELLHGLPSEEAALRGGGDLVDQPTTLRDIEDGDAANRMTGLQEPSPPARADAILGSSAAAS
jgi:hypothetical protein